MMTGISANIGSALSAVSTAQPSMCGISTSRVITAGRVVQPQALLTIRGRGDQEALTFQEAAHHIAHHGVVIDHQDGTCPVRTHTWGGTGLPSASTSAGASAAGNRTVKVDPCPSSLTTSMSPPSMWQRRLVMANPRPVPPKVRVVEASAWEKVWNSFSICSGVIPMPESVTANVIHLRSATTP